MPYPPYLVWSACVIFFQSSEYPGRKSCLEYPKGTKFKGMASQFQGTPLSKRPLVELLWAVTRGQTEIDIVSNWRSS